MHLGGIELIAELDQVWWMLACSERSEVMTKFPKSTKHRGQ